MTVAPPWCGSLARRQTPSPTRKPFASASVISWSYQSESAASFDVADGSFTRTVSGPLPTSRRLEHRYTALRSRQVPGRSFTVPPPIRATVSTAAWMTRWSGPQRSPLALPTVRVNSSSHCGPCRASPEVARGWVTGGRPSPPAGRSGTSPARPAATGPAITAAADAEPRKRRRSTGGGLASGMRASGVGGRSPECTPAAPAPPPPPAGRPKFDNPLCPPAPRAPHD